MGRGGLGVRGARGLDLRLRRLAVEPPARCVFLRGALKFALQRVEFGLGSRLRPLGVGSRRRLEVERFRRRALLAHEILASGTSAKIRVCIRVSSGDPVGFLIFRVNAGAGAAAAAAAAGGAGAAARAGVERGRRERAASAPPATTADPARRRFAPCFSREERRRRASWPRQAGRRVVQARGFRSSTSRYALRSGSPVRQSLPYTIASGIRGI